MSFQLKQSVIVAVLLACPAVLAGSEPAAGGRDASTAAGAGQALAKPDNGGLGDLIAELGSPSYAQREHATALLKSRDKSSVEQIQAVYPSVDDHEIRLRLRDIAEHLFYRDVIDNLGGFLGIRLKVVGNQEDPRLNPNQGAILVVEVLPATAAAEAGLQQGDLITGVEGHQLDLSNGDSANFVDLIGSMRPGTPVRLILHREAQVIAAQVILGRKSLGTLNRTRLGPEDLATLEETAREFEQWWLDTSRGE